MTKCDSYHCEEHRGEIRSVVVYGHGYKYGPYSYCKNAVAEDEKRGFTVHVTEEGD